MNTPGAQSLFSPEVTGWGTFDGCNGFLFLFCLKKPLRVSNAIYVCMYEYLYVFMYVYTYVHVCVCVCVRHTKHIYVGWHIEDTYSCSSHTSV